MARSRTIAELEEAVRWQADIEEAELRHTSEKVRHAINQSIQRFREKISDNGSPYFLTSHSGQIPAGAAKDINGQEFAWGALDITGIQPGVVRIYGLDLSLNSINFELKAVTFKERNNYQTRYTLQQVPIAFFNYNENMLGIVPVPDKGYTYTLWYLPELPILMDDGDTFNPGVPGAEEWVVWDVLIKLLTRDNYPRLLNVAQATRDDLWRDIIHRANKHQRSGPATRLDTRGQSRRNRRRAWFSFWGGS